MDGVSAVVSASTWLIVSGSGNVYGIVPDIN